mmetsp:Transcript_16327/g.53232  ORF Transcript_16327/g.53232 Transcript_16327/m.53232 type:complete len:352 (-) Transcript_16327:625-1680(-)
MHEFSGVASERASQRVAYRGEPSARKEAATSAGCRSRCGAKPAWPSLGSTHHARVSKEGEQPVSASISREACASRSHASSNRRSIVAGQPSAVRRSAPRRSAATARASQQSSDGASDTNPSRLICACSCASRSPCLHTSPPSRLALVARSSAAAPPEPLTLSPSGAPIRRQYAAALTAPAGSSSGATETAAATSRRRVRRCRSRRRSRRPRAQQRRSWRGLLSWRALLAVRRRRERRLRSRSLRRCARVRGCSAPGSARLCPASLAPWAPRATPRRRRPQPPRPRGRRRAGRARPRPRPRRRRAGPGRCSRAPLRAAAGAARAPRRRAQRAWHGSGARRPLRGSRRRSGSR